MMRIKELKEQIIAGEIDPLALSIEELVLMLKIENKKDLLDAIEKVHGILDIYTWKINAIRELFFEKLNLVMRASFPFTLDDNTITFYRGIELSSIKSKESPSMKSITEIQATDIEMSTREQKGKMLKRMILTRRMLEKKKEFQARLLERLDMGEVNIDDYLLESNAIEEFTLKVSILLGLMSKGVIEYDRRTRKIYKI